MALKRSGKADWKTCRAQTWYPARNSTSIHRRVDTLAQFCSFPAHPRSSNSLLRSARLGGRRNQLSAGTIPQRYVPSRHSPLLGCFEPWKTFSGRPERIDVAVPLPKSVFTVRMGIYVSRISGVLETSSCEWKNVCNLAGCRMFTCSSERRVRTKE